MLKRFGYYLELNSFITELPFEYLTHTSYSFLIPNRNGSIDNKCHSKLRDFTNNARAKNKTIKVMASVGGWCDENNNKLDDVFSVVANDYIARMRLVDECINIVNMYQLDGIDLDWEFPITPDAIIGYLQLLKDFRMALGDKLLTIAVSEDKWNSIAVTEEVIALCDFINVMAYDGYTHGSVESAVNAICNWMDRAPDDKIVLGIPLYGMPDGVSYKNILNKKMKNINYNDKEMVEHKTILGDTYGGLMFWHIGQDASGNESLIKHCSKIRNGDNAIS